MLSESSTTADHFSSLRKALTAAADDPTSVRTVLAGTPDQGSRWLQTAYAELRRMLTLGHLYDAAEVGALVGSVLAANEESPDDELAETRIHREAMDSLIEGVRAVLDADFQSGAERLSRVTRATYANPSLRWAAWIWMSKARAEMGALEEARTAASGAEKLSGELDQYARSTSLFRLGELDFIAGRSDEAMESLVTALQIFEDLGDDHGTARVWLARARVQAYDERLIEAADSVKRARRADPGWEEPALFLARLALTRGDVDGASEILKPLSGGGYQSPEVARELTMLQLVRDGIVPIDIIKEYSRSRECPPSEENVRRLEALANRFPLFFQLRDLLGWQLLKLGRYDDARNHFERLSGERDLDGDLHSSVLLGLACLASKANQHQPAGARLRAATSAGLARIDTSELIGRSAKLAGTPRAEFVQRDGLTPGQGTVTAVHAAVSGTFSAPSTAAPPLERRPTQPENLPGPLGRVHTFGDVAGPPTGNATFVGDLQLLPVPDLLSFLNASRRTGALMVTSSQGIGAVQLKDGKILGAASPNHVALGELLKRAGVITDQQIGAALDAAPQTADGKRPVLGALLIRQNLVTEEDVQRALSAQIHSAVREMVSWKAGRFAFEPDVTGEVDASEITVELDTQGVLLEVMRTMDEAGR